MLFLQIPNPSPQETGLPPHMLLSLPCAIVCSIARIVTVARTSCFFDLFNLICTQRYLRSCARNYCAELRVVLLFTSSLALSAPLATASATWSFVFWAWSLACWALALTSAWLGAF